MTTATTEAPRRSARAVLNDFFARVGRGIVAYTEILSRSHEAQRLYAMSDEQLARTGLRREDIVRHVFRDKILL